MSGGIKRMMHEVWKEAERQGADVTRHKGGGIRVKCPSGAVVIVHSSPSARRASMMLKKDLERAGIEPPAGGWTW